MMNTTGLNIVVVGNMTKKINIKIENNWDKFCKKFNKLDMDKEQDVKKLSNIYKKWTKWNKGDCTIEILKSFEFDKIIVLHNLFMDTKYEDSWEFLDDILYILDMYSEESEENWKNMNDFWNKELNK